MASERNPFRAIQCSSCCAIFFGLVSVVVGISEACVWLSYLGVFGGLSHDGTNRLAHSYGDVSGVGLIIIAACGLWCGLWIVCLGACGCSMRLGQPSDKNNRIRIVVCIASAFNALIFCPVQIGLYGYLFKPEDAWNDKLYILEEPGVWWQIMFQVIGITSGAASLVICIMSIVIALRTKPYAGEAKTWDDFDI